MSVSSIIFEISKKILKEFNNFLNRKLKRLSSESVV